MENESAATRRQNFRRLIQRDFRGNQSFFARAYAPGNERPNFINDLIREGSKKPFGEKAARRVELATGLLPGQLSIPNSPSLKDRSRRERTADEAHSGFESLTDEKQELLAAHAQDSGASAAPWPTNLPCLFGQNGGS